MLRWTRSMALAAAMCAAPAGATVLTVGPHGTYDTIQAALDVASAGGIWEVRVEAGTYVENLTINNLATDFGITIDGGWDAAFTSRVTDASATVIDGSSSDYCLHATIKNQALYLDGLTFTRGARQGSGAVYLDLRGDATGEVTNCRFVDNTVSWSGTGGGGMLSTVVDTAQLTVQDSVFRGNTLDGQDSIAVGAGLWVNGQDGSHMVVTRNLIADNRGSSAGNQVTGTGLYVLVEDNATAEVTDNIVARNLETSTSGGVASGGGAALWSEGAAQLTARRNAFLANGSATDTYNSQVSLFASGSSSLVFTDSVAAAGAGASTGGIGAGQSDTATIVVSNVTVADNTAIGLGANGGGRTLPVVNSIMAGNGNNSSALDGATVTSSMVGGDPLFVDDAHWDYRLAAGSPAIDAGDDSPPGGLGMTDLAGTPRQAGDHVDQGAYEYRQSISVVPVVAHLTGAGSTPWRSSLTAADLMDEVGDFDLVLAEGGDQTGVAESLAPSATESFGDVVVDPLGFPSSEQHSGALWAIADSPGMLFSSRTFADPGAGKGTYGQFLPAVGEADLLTQGDTAIIPLVRSDTGFYANVGMVNGGDSSCTGEVRLFDATGTQVGTTQTMTAAPHEWAQIFDVFAKAVAGSHSVAYATVDVTTPGGKAWFYGSVVDRTTRDPTTVPMQQAVPAGTVLRLPAAAHVSGVGGTPWRTTLGIVNGGTGSATVTLVYRTGSTTVTRTVTIPAGGVQAYDDLLVGLFGYTAADTTSGSVEITANQSLAVAGRSYADMGIDGTYGQYLPALDAGREGTGSLVAGVLTQVRKDGAFYTNVGFQNLGREACDVLVGLYGPDGSRLGSTATRTVAGGAWLQINDVFAATGGGTASVAYAVVEVLTPGGRVWAYASVVDSTSHDPTTVPLARPWVIGPPIA